MKSKALIFLSLLSFVSCEDNSDIEGVRFSDSSFDEIVELRSELCPLEILGTPSQLIYYDSLLFIINSSVTPMVDIISTDDYSLAASRVHKGHAGSELLMCRDFMIDYPLVWAFDMQQGVLTSYNYDEFVSGGIACNCVDRLSLNGNTTTNIAKFGDDRFVGTNFLRNELITIYDSTGAIDSTSFAKVPYSFKAPHELSPVESTYFYMRDFAYSDSRNMLVAFYNNKHLFEIYDEKLQLHKRVIGPLREELGSELEELYFTYSNACSTKEYIYLLYLGIPMAPVEKEINSILYQFDYDGTPIRKYKLDRAVNCISVSKDNKVMYAISSPVSSVELLKYEL